VFNAIQPADIILIAIFLLVAFPIHEFAHAATAFALGDATAKLYGRMTLNPIVHFDPIGGLMTVVTILLSPFLLGWAKPTPVNPANLRDRRNGEVFVSLAGPASNMIMAILGAFVVRIVVAAGVQPPELVATALTDFVVFNVALAVFNLIPVPPLDGSALLYRLLTPRQVWQVRPFLTQYGMFIVLAVVLLGGRIVGDVIFGVSRFLMGAS
jgi:Zn-dependent protease